MITLEAELGNLGTILEKYYSLDGQENQLLINLNLSVIHSENERPVSNALISIESIGKTAVCNCEGQVCISELKPGSYFIDIISPGFIAQRVSILVPIVDTFQIRVKMISNS
ncbi:hypothetical protein [Daejeonella sp.]|jgi:hypothetical protein|uniref:hypothetical protein n=1 Tax=Daejeonella sp. TaxID=2805397 RepID=UPI003784EDE1